MTGSVHSSGGQYKLEHARQCVDLASFTPNVPVHTGQVQPRHCQKATLAVALQMIVQLLSWHSC